MYNKQFKTKEEMRKYHREYRAKNLRKMRKYKRTYNKKWRKENGYHNEWISRMRYPEKEHARKLLNAAIRKGLIKRGNCRVCGKRNGQGHHDDYFKPLKVKWLCPLHHREYHKKLLTVCYN